MISWKQAALAVTIGLLIVFLSTLFQAKFPECAPAEDCPTGLYSGWPVAFKFTTLECQPATAGGEGCAPRSVYSYNYPKAAVDLAFWSGLSYLGLGLLSTLGKKK